MSRIKVFLHGEDKVGWSIDYDRKYTALFLRQLGYPVTTNFFVANVVHSVWWNLLLSFRVYPLRWKKVIAFTTNEANTDSPEFRMAKSFVDLWVAPSRAMYCKLELAGVDVKYQPFYVDEKIFFRLNKSKEEIARELGIDYEPLLDKLIIASFQRDSLGTDLSQPKWQKGPELLANILSLLPKSKFVLLLAGPRRHWVINQCKEFNIPYFYYGREPKEYEDDIRRNTLDKPTINKLYNLSDLYIVSSRSEGGPKAILESAFTKTMILSTNVGLAPDFLDPWCIYSTAEEAVQKIKEIADEKDLSGIVESHYDKAYSKASYQPMLDRWKEIYEYFEDTYLA
jgi:hypothetical protein